MRRLILAATAPLLLAQGAHYEGGMLIAPAFVEKTLRLPRHPEAIPTLVFTDPDGHSRALKLPPELDGRLGRCLQVTHHQGRTYALGFVHLPVPPGKAGREALKQTYFQMPRRLYACGPDGRWTLLARMEADPSFAQGTLLPLGSGRFLMGQPALCWQGEAVSPFGVYQLKGGHLQLERLVDLGLGGPWYRPVPLAPGSDEAKRFGRGPKISAAYQELEGRPEAWQVLRLPMGLCFLHLRSRRWFLLDERASRCLGQGRIGGSGPEEVLAAAVRPDGRMLVATRPGTSSERFKASMAKVSVIDLLGPHQSPGAALLTGRAEALRSAVFREEPVKARWWILDITSGQAWATPPPVGYSLQIPPFAPMPLDLQVLPNGHLKTAGDHRWWVRPSRLRYDWLDRLLKPFTHDWRKLEP